MKRPYLKLSGVNKGCSLLISKHLGRKRDTAFFWSEQVHNLLISNRLEANKWHSFLISNRLEINKEHSFLISNRLVTHRGHSILISNRLVAHRGHRLLISNRLEMKKEHNFLFQIVWDEQGTGPSYFKLKPSDNEVPILWISLSFYSFYYPSEYVVHHR